MYYNVPHEKPHEALFFWGLQNEMFWRMFRLLFSICGWCLGMHLCDENKKLDKGHLLYVNKGQFGHSGKKVKVKQ